MAWCFTGLIQFLFLQLHFFQRWENKKIGKVKVIQIAGFLARRIICTVSRGEKVNKGQRVGGILLGSQVSLILPARKIELIVSADQRVIGGETIIASLK